MGKVRAGRSTVVAVCGVGGADIDVATLTAQIEAGGAEAIQVSPMGGIALFEEPSEAFGWAMATVAQIPSLSFGLDNGDAIVSQQEAGEVASGAAVEWATALASSGWPGAVLVANALWQTLARSGELTGVLGVEQGPVRLPGSEQEDIIVSAHIQEGSLSSMTVPTNLGDCKETFIGREEELSKIETIFRQGTSALTVMGPGGMGKSRLVRRYGALHLSDYAGSGGVMTCKMHRVHSLERFNQTVASALDLPLRTHGLNAISRLGDALAARGRTLLILDSVERGARFLPVTVGEWLKVCPHLQVLATSRERLDIAGERVLSLEPMSTQDASVLFAIESSRSIATAEFDPTLFEEVEHISQQIEGVPLAIELAAAWTELLTMEQLKWRLDSGLSLLTESPHRHGLNLSTVMEFSWELMTAWERDVFVQCSVFKGGFVVEAAEAIIELGQYPAAPPLQQVLISLHDKSLIQLQPGSSSVRYRMYDVVAAYAEEKFNQSSIRASVEARHAVWYLACGERCAEAAVAGELGATAALEIETDNLMAVVERRQKVKPAQAVSALLVMEPLFVTQGPYDLWARQMQHAVNLSSGLSVDVRARASGALADALVAQGRAVEAVELLNKIISELEETDKIRTLGLLQVRLSKAYLALGEMTKAQKMAVTASEVLSSSPGFGWVLAQLGRVQFVLGEFGAARKTLSEAAASMVRPRERASVLALLGDVRRAIGEVQSAGDHYREALTITRSLKDLPAEANILSKMGSLALDLNQSDESEAHFKNALNRYQEVGDRHQQVIVSGNLGRVSQNRSLLDEASVAFQIASEALEVLGDKRFAAVFAGHQATVMSVKGDVKAVDSYLTCIDALKASGDKRFYGLFLARLGAMEADIGNPTAAKNRFLGAEEVISKGRDPMGAAAIAVHRAHIELSSGGTEGREKAIASYRTAVGEDGSPGPASLSYDVRLAAMMLRQKLEGTK